MNHKFYFFIFVVAAISSHPSRFVEVFLWILSRFIVNIIHEMTYAILYINFTIGKHIMKTWMEKEEGNFFSTTYSFRLKSQGRKEMSNRKTKGDFFLYFQPKMDLQFLSSKLIMLSCCWERGVRKGNFSHVSFYDSTKLNVEKCIIHFIEEYFHVLWWWMELYMLMHRKI